MAFRVSVIGAGDADPGVALLAERVGALVGARGWLLVTGGLGGVMEAASRGARAAGGRTLGILPGTDPRAANPHVEVPVATGLGAARNALVVRGCPSSSWGEGP